MILLYNNYLVEDIHFFLIVNLVVKCLVSSPLLKFYPNCLITVIKLLEER